MHRINFYIARKKLDFLQELEGTISEHLRNAVDDYIEKKSINTSASQSKRKAGD